MDSIPISDNQEYVVVDNNFSVIEFSANIQKYADKNISTGEDIRNSFPEVVGLESICQEILSKRQQSFVLKSISRSKTKDNAVYFDLYFNLIEQHLVILLEDVTELMTLRQYSIQKLNEAEIALNKLQRFEYCTNKIITSMKDVLLITTPAGRIERVNKSTTKLLGQKKLVLLDQLVDDLIGDPSFNHQQIYNLLLSSPDSVYKIEVNFKTEQNKTIHIEFDCFIAPTEIKDFYNCVYIGRDVTARKKAEAKIRKSLAREKELRQLKSGFISMASHEFRNPLSSILLCAQNLSGNDSLSQSESEFYLKSIQDAALNMNSLLEDILVLSKAESGKQKLKPELINLRNFCWQIVQELTSIYVDKKVNFNYLLSSDAVNFDRATLRHILNNLLSNALKYSPTGKPVDLTISKSSKPEGITIEVRDRGIGIPKKSQKHLFESFYRASNVDSTPGTGLGLSIVKKAVELCQGSITINSQLNKGTNIVVKLPIKE